MGVSRKSLRDCEIEVRDLIFNFILKFVNAYFQQYLSACRIKGDLIDMYSHQSTYNIKCTLHLRCRNVLSSIPDIDEAICGCGIHQGLGDVELVDSLGGDVDDGNGSSFGHDDD